MFKERLVKRFGFALIVISALLGSIHAEAKRTYRYTLDPNRAEEVLAGIELNRRIPPEQWLGILGTKKNESYTVQEGDNLWNISKATTGDPWLWRKLWQMNPQLGNPHDISTGQILAYYREQADPPARRIPMIKLIPNRPGAVSDLDSDSIVSPEIKHQYRSVFFVLEENEFLGEIKGALATRSWLSELDELFIDFYSGEAVASGTRFSVVRKDRRISDQRADGRPFLGYLVRLVAEVEIVRSGPGDFSKAVLVKQLENVSRGDILIPVREATRPMAVFNPPEDLSARILEGEIPDAQYFFQGQVVLLDKGADDGIREGYLFRVSWHEDPKLKSSAFVNEDYKGEIQVLTVGALSSVGLVLRNKVPLTAGDLLVAAQRFPNPPPSPRREVREIEIN